MVSYDSEELVTPLSGSVSVQVITQNTDSFRAYQPRTPPSTSSAGVCVPFGCDTDMSRSYTVTMTATYMNQYLTPVDAQSESLPATFSFTSNMVDDLDYVVQDGDANSAIQIRPLQTTIGQSENGPIYRNSGTCQTSNIQNDESRYFQFYVNSPSMKLPNAFCYSTESAASSIATRSYYTFYPNLPNLPSSQLIPESRQEYCFVGIRIRTIYTGVRIKVSSRIRMPQTVSNSISGYVDNYGERRITANPVNGIIDTCMEFKCRGELFTGFNSNGFDDTKVTVYVEGVRGRCSVTPSDPLMAITNVNENACNEYGYRTPFCFVDTGDDGPQIGIFRFQSSNIPVGSCEGDMNSPQNTNLDHCIERGSEFNPALDITC